MSLSNFWVSLSRAKLCRESINFEVRYSSRPALTALLTAPELAHSVSGQTHRHAPVPSRIAGSPHGGSMLQHEAVIPVIAAHHQAWLAARLASSTALLVRQYVQGFFLSRHARACVCECVCVRKVMSICGVAGRVLLLFFCSSSSFLISTFFGSFLYVPARRHLRLNLLLSCRLNSAEVTKNALKTGSRAATHSYNPCLCQTHSHSLTLALFPPRSLPHSFPSYTNHLPNLKLKSRRHVSFRTR